MRPREELGRGLTGLGWEPAEAGHLARLIDLFLRLPSSGPGHAFPDLGRLQDRLARVAESGSAEDVESALLRLYDHVHMSDAPYSPEERRRMDASGGYWNHAGGLSPIVKAGPWIAPDTASADFGAGNGLQALLLQVLFPHARTVQIEISARMRDIGESLREWIGVPRQRVEWVTDDVLETPATGYDFVYLYRPVRPEGPGRDFYARFAREVESEARPPVIFSVADCLRDFLSARYEVFYSDGHLTCLRPAAGDLAELRPPSRRR